MPILHWFRRDLRLRDNTAFSAAVRDSRDGVIPVFIFDDSILRHPDTGAPIVAFMLDCLRGLRDELRRRGGDLVFLHGSPAEELRRLAAATGASAIYYNKDYAPAAVERDMAVERALAGAGVGAGAGVRVRGFKDQVIFEEQEILSISRGEPYTVYTPYRRAWEKRLLEMGDGESGPDPLPLPRLRFASVPKGQGIELPTAASLGFELKYRIEIPAGESAGRRMLERFCQEPLRRYARDRNFPAVEGTSRLSPHLRHGTLSPRTCLRAAITARREGGRAFALGANTWISELIWRDFYQQILFNFPEVEREPFRPQWRRLRWRKDEGDWQRWEEGRTGFPIVDAAMRQLNTTAWMHNRLRMIVAMFLTKDLLLDYHLGERWFMRNLIDGETAQNNGGWQWSASTGTDAQPWFRIFNPATQSRACDPDGAFIRRWCPELAKVPGRFIHAPHEMTAAQQEASGCRIGRDYPAPMVDHAQARARALAAFKAIKTASGD